MINLRRLVFISALLISTLFPYSAQALKFPGMTSTTDYLVRLEALAYLEDLTNSKAELKRRIEAATKKIGESNYWTADEIGRLNKRIIEVNTEIANLLKSSSDLVNLIILEKNASKERLSENIKNAQAQIKELNNPTIMTQIVTGVLNYAKARLYTRDEHAEREAQEKYAKELDKNIAFWQLEIGKIVTALNSPEVLKGEAKEKIAIKMMEWEDQMEDAKTQLSELKEESGILALESAVKRNLARLVSADDTAACMVKLAKCKDLKSWADYSAPNTKKCRTDNLTSAKKKAKNPKCAALNIDSRWQDIDACIPEYRAGFPKKSSTEGARIEFDKCRRM